MDKRLQVINKNCRKVNTMRKLFNQCNSNSMFSHSLHAIECDDLRKAQKIYAKCDNKGV